MHGSGVVLTLDRTRLVFACNEDLTPADLAPILTSVDLAIDFGEDLPPLPDESSEQVRVGNTPRLFWVRDTNAAPIGQSRFDTLRDVLASVLDWIGPIYRAGAASGREGLLCPLPHVLVVEPTAALDAADPIWGSPALPPLPARVNFALAVRGADSIVLNPSGRPSPSPSPATTSATTLSAISGTAISK